jgi:hypothetical protein
MSAQGGPISGRAPLHLPIRPIVTMLLVATTPPPTGWRRSRSRGTMLATRRLWSSARATGIPPRGTPALRGRPGDEEAVATEVPAQRLYPNGFGQRVKNDTPQRFELMRRKR